MMVAVRPRRRAAVRSLFFSSSLSLALLLACGGAGEALAQSSRGTAAGSGYVVGRVLDSAGTPISRATITLGRAGTDRVEASTSSDTTGRFVVSITAGIPLLLKATRIGYVGASIYLPRGPAANDTLRQAIRLNRMPVVTATLPALVTRARRSPAERHRETPGESRAAEFSFLLDKMPIGAGSLADIAALAPGVVTTGGIEESIPQASIAGQSPDRNHTSVDGSSFGGSSLPPEAIASAGVVLNQYDASRGQFTGGELVATTRSGTNYWAAAMRALASPAVLRYGSPALPGTGNRVNSGQVNGGGGGAIVPDRLFVYGAFVASRRSGPVSFLNANDPRTLRQLGLSPDSVRRFADVARSLGVPQRDGDDLSATNDVGSGMAKLDFAAGERHLLTLRLEGRSSSATGIGASPYALAGTGGLLRTTDRGAFLKVSSRFESFSHDARVYATTTRRTVRPGLDGPAARVQSASDSVSDALQLFTFGGNPFGISPMSRRFVEIADEIAAPEDPGSHAWRVGVIGNRESSDIQRSATSNGLFNFASIGDFALNRPSSFTRGAIDRQLAEVGYAALYANDEWMFAPRKSVSLGLRAEGSWYPGIARLDSAAIASAPALASAGFLAGRRMSLPAEQRLLPRFGFSLRGEGGRLAVKGGVGSFSARLGSGALAGPLNERGTAFSLTCLGPAAPTPTWSSYIANAEAIPTACVSGSPAFTDTKARTTLFASDFRAPISHRGSLDIDWQVANARFLHVRATLIRNHHEPLATDVNLDRQPRFALNGEGSRPVFVPADAIDPLSGGVSPSLSRLAPTLGVVREIGSGGRAATEQFGIGFEGLTRWGGAANVWYTYTSSRDLTTGMTALGGSSASTAGDPAVAEWSSRDYVQRHVFQATLMQRVARRVELVGIGRVMSGTSFTPMVDGDVNGDGSVGNDRAFVFDPATASDAAVRAGMRDLLANAPGRTRACLTAQRGLIAARNSCVTAWSTLLDLQSNIGPFNFAGSQQLTITLMAQNAAAGLDYLLHGASGLRGWGQFAFVDNTLLRVRGFEAGAKAFRYEVNPAFGSYGSARGPRSPFALTLQARVTLGPDPARQAFASLMALAMSNRRRPERVANFLATRFPDTPRSMLALDTARHALGLSAEQREQLRLISLRDGAARDSLLRGLLDGLTSTDTSRVAAIPALVERADDLADAMRSEARRVLTAAQWEKLPDWMRTTQKGKSIQPPIPVSIPNP